MAEAIVERPAMSNTRYFCHICNVEINIPNDNFTCPICAGGFVEELPSAPQVPPVNAPGAGTSRSDNNAIANNQIPINRLNDLNAIRGEIATILLDRFGPNIEISVDPNVQRIEGTVNQPQGAANQPQAAPRMRRNFGPNVLIDFLNSLDGHFGNASMVYLGNIGDYAWGREGIDTIVTQLLNQMETAGPPPLSRDKIDEIPKVEVTPEEVDKKTQCSVCWEDFVLNEIVRKLPCSHIFHENCIVPWLDLHGTCPICRKSLTNDDESQDDPHTETPHNSNPGSGGNPDGGAQRQGGAGVREPPTMRNSALDDLD